RWSRTSRTAPRASTGSITRSTSSSRRLASTSSSSRGVPMLPSFDIAAASVIGREHARAGRNNQDAFSLLAQGEVLAAVVADGCGSGAHSEVGAQLGARCVAQAVLAVASEGVSVEDPGFLEAVRARVLKFLTSLTEQLGGSL